MPSEGFLKCFKEQNLQLLIKISLKCHDKLNYIGNKIVGTCATKDYDFIVDNLEDKKQVLVNLFKKSAVYIIDKNMVKLAQKYSELLKQSAGDGLLEASFK